MLYGLVLVDGLTDEEAHIPHVNLDGCQIGVEIPQFGTPLKMFYGKNIRYP